MGQFTFIVLGVMRGYRRIQSGVGTKSQQVRSCSLVRDETSSFGRSDYCVCARYTVASAVDAQQA